MVQAYTALADINNRVNSRQEIENERLLKGKIDWRFCPLTNAKQK
jgi:hypothetical protein